MPKNILLVALLLTACCSLLIISYAQEQPEQITVTTYYPSPYGSYDQLTTTGNTTLATNPGSVVGIGTTNPSPDYLLEVNGALQADDYFSGDGTPGLTSDVIVKGSDGNNCTMTFKDGLLTSEDCP